MAGKYETEARDFYEDCKADGGAIKILRQRTEHVDTSDPSSDVVNPAAWKGSDEEPLMHETFALMFPTSSNVNPIDQAYIPSHGLDFIIVKGMFIQTADDKISEIMTVSPLNPDGTTPIFYQCNIEHRPGYSFNG